MYIRWCVVGSGLLRLAGSDNVPKVPDNLIRTCKVHMGLVRCDRVWSDPIAFKQIH